MRALLLVGLMLGALPRHELAEASLTLVVREGGHLELRAQVPWAEVLHARLMPRAPMVQFLTQLVDQRPADFARTVSSLEAEIARETWVEAPRGAPIRFERWQWPRTEEIREALRRELMSRVATPGAVEHASRLPAGAEVVLGAGVSTLQVRSAPVLGPTLLTVQKPTEQWLAPGGRSTAIVIRG